MKKVESYCVVIIGGGPAGITAGITLQKHGFKTCIIDKASFPRDKLCGGVLTKKTVKLVKKIYSENILTSIDTNYVDKLTFYYKNKVYGKYKVNNGYIVINRKQFDMALLNNYTSAGGKIFQDERCYKINYEKNEIELKDGKKISYDFLIGADGVNSKVRRYVASKWNTAIFCFEKFISQNDENKKDNIDICFGCTLGGYNWIIPGKKDIGIGMGEFYFRRQKRTPIKLEQYSRQIYGKMGQSDIRGAFLPSGRYIKKPIKNNVLLVGDAAGLVDAMTGEGIFFAVESGYQAALAIYDCLKNGKEINNYCDRIKKIHIRMDEQNIYNKLMYTPLLQWICIYYTMKHPEFAQRAFDLVISTYQSGYTRELLKDLLNIKNI